MGYLTGFPKNYAKLQWLQQWERVTFSRITTIYFLFSVAHCFIQVILQVQAFSINQQAAQFLYSILSQGNATDPNGFTVLSKTDLRMCDSVPSSFSTASCRVLWNGTALTDNVAAAQASAINSTLQTALNTATDSTSLSLSVSTSSVSTFTSAVTSVSAVTSASATQTSSAQKSTTTTSKPNNDVNAAVGPTRTLTVFATAPTSSPNHVDVDGHDDDDDDDDNDRDEFTIHHKRTDTDLGKIAATEVNGQVQVNITGLGYNNQPITVDRTCLWALNYPVEILLNTKREDITFIAFQLWVLGMSVVALLNESIPHILASLLTHMLATAWAGFQIAHTRDFHSDFARLTTNGACKPINLLPQYWLERSRAEYPLLVLNVVALLISAFLTWRLVKLFGWQTFKRVGASMTINRVYKLVLVLSINLQLALFFMVATIGLWIDQLWNGQIAHLARLAHIYKPIFIVVLILLVPWLMMGWVAVRKELRIPMLVFLVLSFGYMAGWGAMFASTTFRWTFVTWRFFSLVASGSALLTLMTLILGLICRLNFGKGLLRYLAAQEPIPDERVPEPFVPGEKNEDDLEKVNFPSHEEAIPTFSVAFGSGDEVPPPSQMFNGRQRGPRFYNQSAEPFEAQGPSLHRSPSSGTLSPEQDYTHSTLTRQDSHSSEHSTRTTNTTLSRNTSHSSQSSSASRSKRWVIE